jgi:cytosine/adenosine deaminase-related metal-dependent hydrolase
MSAHPGLAPARVWAMATEGGARALGLTQEVGRLAPGALADLAVFACAARSPRAAVEELTGGLPAVLAVLLGGERADAGSEPHPRAAGRLEGPSTAPSGTPLSSG